MVFLLWKLRKEKSLIILTFFCQTCRVIYKGRSSSLLKNLSSLRVASTGSTHCLEVNWNKNIILSVIFLFFYSVITGAMIALCDINEYRHTIKEFKIPLVERLFGVLLALVNLLVVQPDNLKEVGNDEQLVILINFVLPFISFNSSVS